MSSMQCIFSVLCEVYATSISLVYSSILISINQSSYLLKLWGEITRATEQNDQDSKDNDITDSCPRNVRLLTDLCYAS